MPMCTGIGMRKVIDLHRDRKSLTNLAKIECALLAAKRAVTLLGRTDTWPQPACVATGVRLSSRSIKGGAGDPRRAESDGPAGGRNGRLATSGKMPTAT